jgi:hypothetical protein
MKTMENKKTTLKQYIKANKKYWKNNFILNYNLGIYKDKNDFINVRLERLQTSLYRVLNLEMTFKEAITFYKNSLIKELNKIEA